MVTIFESLVLTVWPVLQWVFLKAYNMKWGLTLVNRDTLRWAAGLVINQNIMNFSGVQPQDSVYHLNITLIYHVKGSRWSLWEHPHTAHMSLCEFTDCTCAKQLTDVTLCFIFITCFWIKCNEQRSLCFLFLTTVHKTQNIKLIKQWQCDYKVIVLVTQEQHNGVYKYVPPEKKENHDNSN